MSKLDGIDNPKSTAEEEEIFRSAPISVPNSDYIFLIPAIILLVLGLVFIFLL
jgi:hypothetical protein